MNTNINKETAAGPKLSPEILKQDDHMRDMERIEMTVISVTQTSPLFKRVLGQINTNLHRAWGLPNVAVRMEMGPGENDLPLTRIYTVRRYDAATSRLEIDFVLHEDSSPAMRWLKDAKPGSKIWMTGPREHFVPPFAPGKTTALFADDTAIPAVFAILQSWPQGAKGQIWIETKDPTAVGQLPIVEGVTLQVIESSMDEPRPKHLLQAAKVVVGDNSAWTVWAAGERTEMVELRQHFRGLGLPKEQLQVIGYWKHGASSSELDQQRLAGYTAARDKGLTLEEIDTI